MDIFSELKQRAETEIEALRKAYVETDDSNKKYKYRKIKVGIEAMLEHIYEVENKFKIHKSYESAVITNAEKIRSMSDEELAELLSDKRSSIDYVDKLEWLQSEAE